MYLIIKRDVLDRIFIYLFIMVMIRHIIRLNYINNIRLLSTKRDLVIIPPEPLVPDIWKDGKKLITSPKKENKIINTEEKIFYHIPGDEKGLPHQWEI